MELAKCNQSVREWARISPPSALQNKTSISISEEEEEELNKMEEPVALDLVRGQRLAQCRAKQTAFVTQNICAILVEAVYTEMEARVREDWEVVANKEVDMMMDKMGHTVDVAITTILEEEAELEMIWSELTGYAVEARFKSGGQDGSWMEEWRPGDDVEGIEYEDWLHDELERLDLQRTLVPPDVSSRGLVWIDLGLAKSNPMSCATPEEPVCTLGDKFGPVFCSTPRTLFEDEKKKKCVTTPGLVSFSTLSPSRKPKPWHIKKKRGIIPDGLVQSRLNHFRMLTNGEGGRNKQLCSTNESPGKRGGSDLNSPKVGKQRKR